MTRRDEHTAEPTVKCGAFETAGPLRMRTDGERATLTRDGGWEVILPAPAARVIFDALSSAYCDDLNAIP